MNPTNVKRSIARDGYKTSVSLEMEFWDGLREIATLRGTKIKSLVEKIDQGRQNGVNLSSAIRVFVFNQLRAKSDRTGDQIPTCPFREFHPARGRIVG